MYFQVGAYRAGEECTALAVQKGVLGAQAPAPAQALWRKKQVGVGDIVTVKKDRMRIDLIEVLSCLRRAIL